MCPQAVNRQENKHPGRLKVGCSTFPFKDWGSAFALGDLQVQVLTKEYLLWSGSQGDIEGILLFQPTFWG